MMLSQIKIVLTCLQLEDMFNDPPYALIRELLQDTNRPLWSVMIPTYNGTKYLGETLLSVLAQASSASDMQIEVVDDASTEDNPESLVHEIGKGRISFFRQKENQGQIQTWNNCIRRARGDWIHIIHQDDTVLPGFYKSIQSAMSIESVGAAFCRNIYMDEDGHWQYFSLLEQKEAGVLENWIDKIAVSQRIQFPSIAVRRSTYERTGGFCLEAHSAADWEMWKRIAAYYPVWYEPKPLACFRLHAGSETSRLVQLGENIAHTREAIKISEQYLPPLKKAQLSKSARENYSFYALGTARQMLVEANTAAAIAQIREALKCRISFKILRVLARVIAEASSKYLLIAIRKGE